MSSLSCRADDVSCDNSSVRLIDDQLCSSLTPEPRLAVRFPSSPWYELCRWTTDPCGLRSCLRGRRSVGSTPSARTASGRDSRCNTPPCCHHTEGHENLRPFMRPLHVLACSRALASWLRRKGVVAVNQAVRSHLLRYHVRVRSGSLDSCGGFGPSTPSPT